MTVVVHRRTPGGHDVYGDPVASTYTVFELDGCLVAPRASTEQTDRGREGVVVGVDLFVPPSCWWEIERFDEVEIEAGDPMAGRYVVDGESAAWRSQGGHDRGMVVPLKRAAG